MSPEPRLFPAVTSFQENVGKTGAARSPARYGLCGKFPVLRELTGIMYHLQELPKRP